MKLLPEAASCSFMQVPRAIRQGARGGLPGVSAGATADSLTSMDGMMKSRAPCPGDERA